MRSADWRATSHFTEEQRDARDKLVSIARTRARDASELDDAAVAQLIEELAPNPFSADRPSDAARKALKNGLEWDMDSPAIWERVNPQARSSPLPEVLRWFSRGQVGEMEQKYGVVFLPPDVLAIREELRQVLEGERTRLAAHLGRTAAPRTKRNRVADKPEEIAQRAELRSRWLDEQISRKRWSECDIKKPSYKTVARFRSGQSSTRELSVRSDLAETFGCRLDEVPE